MVGSYIFSLPLSMLSGKNRKKNLQGPWKLQVHGGWFSERTALSTFRTEDETCQPLSKLKNMSLEFLNRDWIHCGVQINIQTCNFCFRFRRIRGIKISTTVILFGLCKPRFPCFPVPKPKPAKFTVQKAQSLDVRFHPFHWCPCQAILWFENNKIEAFKT